MSDPSSEPAPAPASASASGLGRSVIQRPWRRPASISLIKLGLLVIVLAWGMRGVIASFAQYGAGNTYSYTVYSKNLAKDQDLASEADLLLLAEKEAEVEGKEAKIAALGRELDTERDEDKPDQDAIDDASDSIKDLRESLGDIQDDIADLEVSIAASEGVIEREQVTFKANAEIDQVSGQAAYQAYQQWNLLLAPIAMLLYVLGVLCLTVGNLGVLASNTANAGLRGFAITSSAVILALMLFDAIDLHAPEGPSTDIPAMTDYSGHKGGPS